MGELCCSVHIVIVLSSFVEVVLVGRRVIMGYMLVVVGHS